MKLSELKLLKKKEEIMDSALRILKQKGAKATTMEDIAAELLMTKGSLYYYFKNKEDLIFQCHDLVLTKAIEDIKENLKESVSYEQRLRNMIGTHLGYGIEAKETFNMIVKPDEVDENEELQAILVKQKDYSVLFDEVIRRGIQAGEFAEVDIKMVRMILLGSMNWFNQWYNPNGLKTKEEIKLFFADYLLKIVQKSS